MSKVNSYNDKNVNDSAKKELNRLFEDLFVKKLSDKASEVIEISKSVHKDVPEKVNSSIKSIGDKIDTCQKVLQESISETTGLIDSIDTQVGELQTKMEAIETKVDEIKDIEQSSQNEITKLAGYKEIIENNIKTYVTDLYNETIKRINNTEKKRFVPLLFLLIVNFLFSLVSLLWFILKR